MCRLKKSSTFGLRMRTRKCDMIARARHTISSTLTMEEFYKVSIYKNAKEMWETLVKAQESIEESNHKFRKQQQQ